MRQQKPPVYPPIGPQSHGQSRGTVTLSSPCCYLDPIRCLPDLAMRKRKGVQRVAILSKGSGWKLHGPRPAFLHNVGPDESPQTACERLLVWTRPWRNRLRLQGILW